jgi:hypothetical protein
MKISVTSKDCRRSKNLIKKNEFHVFESTFPAGNEDNGLKSGKLYVLTTLAHRITHQAGQKGPIL